MKCFFSWCTTIRVFGENVPLSATARWIAQFLQFNCKYCVFSLSISILFAHRAPHKKREILFWWLIGFFSLLLFLSNGGVMAINAKLLRLLSNVTCKLSTYTHIHCYCHCKFRISPEKHLDLLEISKYIHMNSTSRKMQIAICIYVHTGNIVVIKSVYTQAAVLLLFCVCFFCRSVQQFKLADERKPLNAANISLCVAAAAAVVSFDTYTWTLSVFRLTQNSETAIVYSVSMYVRSLYALFLQKNKTNHRSSEMQKKRYFENIWNPLKIRSFVTSTLKR